jgi:hypothetical protein
MHAWVMMLNLHNPEAFRFGGAQYFGTAPGGRHTPSRASGDSEWKTASNHA